MDSLSATRERVDDAASDTDRLAALLNLASALFEYDAAEATLVGDQAIVLADLLGEVGVSIDPTEATRACRPTSRWEDAAVSGPRHRGHLTA